MIQKAVPWYDRNPLKLQDFSGEIHPDFAIDFEVVCNGRRQLEYRNVRAQAPDQRLLGHPRENVLYAILSMHALVLSTTSSFRLALVPSVK